MDLHNLLRKTRKTRKSVKIDETRNTVRTLSAETKNDNYQLSKSVKNEVWLRRNNESNNDAPSPERGIGEIQPRLSKSQIKAHRTETLKNVNQPSRKSNTGCTICGGKNHKTHKVRNNRKKRKN
jgi:hypothetical protein